jgi:hypothetical protein
MKLDAPSEVDQPVRWDAFSARESRVFLGLTLFRVLFHYRPAALADLNIGRRPGSECHGDPISFLRGELEVVSATKL